MSSKRDLKKYINKGMDEVAFKAILMLRDCRDERQGPVLELLKEIGDFREDLLNRLQTRLLKLSPKDTADHYRQLHDDLSMKLSQWKTDMGKLESR